MDMNTVEQRTNNTRFSAKHFGYLLILVLCVAIGAMGMYFFSQKASKPVPKGEENKVQAEADVKSLLKEIGTFMVLPDETPTVATITDSEKITSQPFFKNAQNGDRVIIFANAKKAILYRPSDKRIIDVGAISVNNKPQEEQNTPRESTESGELEE